jgi:hypothetical protein
LTFASLGFALILNVHYFIDTLLESLLVAITARTTNRRGDAAMVFSLSAAPA